MLGSAKDINDKDVELFLDSQTCLGLIRDASQLRIMFMLEINKNIMGLNISQP
jgi:hypothetical protein